LLGVTVSVVALLNMTACQQASMKQCTTE